MNELMEKYAEMFDEQFPLMLCMGMSEDDIMQEIQKCIDSGEPYEPDMGDDIIY